MEEKPSNVRPAGLMRQIARAFKSPPVIGLLGGMVALLLFNYLTLRHGSAAYYAEYWDGFVTAFFCFGGIGLTTGFAVDFARGWREQNPPRI
jgi:hypothetical protein